MKTPPLPPSRLSSDSIPSDSKPTQGVKSLNVTSQGIGRGIGASADGKIHIGGNGRPTGKCPK